jgi:imidazolonepropionase-like amidohydrolase
VHDTLRLYYVGRAVGYEIYDLTPEGSGFRLSADFSYVDRGRRTHLTGLMRVSADYAHELLEISRFADTAAALETRVETTEGAAMVFARGVTTRVPLPVPGFAIAAHAPVSQHLLLMRYWLAHGRPRSLEVVPGGPTNTVSIHWRGRDTIPGAAGPSVLERYAVDGVAWGYESVWIDAESRIAGLATRAGNLTFAAVRVALEKNFSQLMASATGDRLADLAALSVPVTPFAQGALVLEGATLIDGTGRNAIPNATVVVSSGRIVAAGAAGTVGVPAGARRLDVRGKTIMPGLWDMHAHMTQIERAPGYLAAGVTTVRDMGSELDFIIRFRAAVDSGRGLGPRMLLAGLVDGDGPNAFGEVSAATPDEGRAVVRKYHELGFQQIKLYDLLAPGVVGAITREAHRLGMTVTGHIPRSLGLAAAIDSGQDQIAHLATRGDPASDSVQRLFASLKRHGTVMDPTLSWNELNLHSTQEPVTSLVPGAALLPPVLAQRIQAMGRSNVDTLRARSEQTREFAQLRALHAAGIPIVAGTDMGVPGFSIVREIELYERAGLTRMEALRAATAVPAEVMKQSHEVGTIEAGKRADLVVLDKNPLESLRNLNSIRFVMKAGVMYRTADLAKAIGYSSRE